MLNRILIIEDAAPLRSLLERYLQHLGYDVATAGCAEDLGEAELAAFDIYLVDLTLPGESGIDLAYRIATRHPSARILLTSGELFKAPEGYAFLQKPFAPAQLAAALQQLSGTE